MINFSHSNTNSAAYSASVQFDNGKEALMPEFHRLNVEVYDVNIELNI